MDDFSYAGVIAGLGALGFFLGNLVLNFGLWQLVVAPIIGGGLGWLCGAWVLKERRLAGLYVFPALMLLDCCCFINDSFAYFASKSRLGLALGFSEVRFSYNQDNSDIPIPLRTKVLHIYPASILFILLLFALVLVTR
ncbi:MULTISPECIES: hypothetical protein [Bradyrhizobium]|uniref:hypothetical protein n=1 Tax=Bradyrhizobium TaxID=374 RepID=UPI001CD816C5|nr:MULTISPECIES: hypothetical protein [Bradyrhizobium]MCA1529408.1 hypothetical protein [Bradyrhizobium yuanmingense]MCA1550111.1 hypothetical protein [Bradyrhizobium sp. BRP19]